jgi:hypothetical protein
VARAGGKSCFVLYDQKEYRPDNAARQRSQNRVISVNPGDWELGRSMRGRFAVGGKAMQRQKRYSTVCARTTTVGGLKRPKGAILKDIHQLGGLANVWAGLCDGPWLLGSWALKSGL